MEEEERTLSNWMKQALGGDRSAYQKLLDAVRARVEAFAKSGLSRAGIQDPASADDVVQEVLLAIHSRRMSYDPVQPFLPWMYAIARYKLIDHLRSARSRSRIDLVADMQDFEKLAPEPGARADARRVLAALPGKQRELIELVKIEGLSIAETALRTGYTLSDVKVSIHRGIQALKKMHAKRTEDGNR